jgi:CRISPR/Cas system CSM-associated protein Csm5 (group 7 of RAMP superfamily)
MNRILMEKEKKFNLYEQNHQKKRTNKGNDVEDENIKKCLSRESMWAHTHTDHFRMCREQATNVMDNDWVKSKHDWISMVNDKLIAHKWDIERFNCVV